MGNRAHSGTGRQVPARKRNSHGHRRSQRTESTVGAPRHADQETRRYPPVRDHPARVLRPPPRVSEKRRRIGRRRVAAAGAARRPRPGGGRRSQADSLQGHHLLQQFLRIRAKQNRPGRERRQPENQSLVGDGRGSLRKTGPVRAGGFSGPTPARRAHLPPALRGSVVDGGAVAGDSAWPDPAAIPADRQREVCRTHHSARSGADAGTTNPIAGLALCGRLAHG